MNKPKIGDKYIIEIDSHMTNAKGDLYGVKGFNSLVFDQNGLDKLTRLEEGETELYVGDEVEDKDGRLAYVLVPHNKDGGNPLLLMNGHGFPRYARRKDWRKIGHAEALELFVKEAYASLVGESKEGEEWIRLRRYKCKPNWCPRIKRKGRYER